MHEENQDVFYYLTVANESYPQPPMPPGDGVREGIVKGLYCLHPADPQPGQPRVHLLGSGAILNEALKAREILARYDVAADVWSATSYTELRRDAQDAERWNRLHPLEAPRLPYVTAALGDDPRVVVAVSDYLKAVPESIAKWVPGSFAALGTDGFGRSSTREELRDFFEVDAHHIVIAALHQLSRVGRIEPAQVQRAIDELGLHPERPNPAAV